MTTTDMQTLFEAGVHFGYDRARRHPTAAPFLFGTKDRTDIFDLEKTTVRVDTVLDFVAPVVRSGKQILFVSGKHEASGIIKSAAERAHMPYVSGRWIGGTLTNFKNIRKRLDLLEKRMKERDTGELEKYTKKERLLIGREIEELVGRFGGLIDMKDLPAALFVIDSRHENIAVREANQLGIPVIGLSSSDCDFSLVQYPIPGNDTSIRSISFVCDAVVDAIQAAKKA